MFGGLLSPMLSSTLFNRCSRLVICASIKSSFSSAVRPKPPEAGGAVEVTGVTEDAEAPLVCWCGICGRSSRSATLYATARFGVCATVSVGCVIFFLDLPETVLRFGLLLLL